MFFKSKMIFVVFLAAWIGNSSDSLAKQVGSLLHAIGAEANLSFMACEAEAGRDHQRQLQSGSLNPRANADPSGITCARTAISKFDESLVLAKKLVQGKPKAIAALKVWYGEWRAAFDRIPISERTAMELSDNLDRLMTHVVTEADW